MNNKLVCIIIIVIFPLFLSAIVKPIQVLKPEYEAENSDFKAIYVSRFDKIYTIDQLNNELYLIDTNGNIINSTGGFGWEAGLFDRPVNISSPDGLNIYIADYNNQRIVAYDRQLNLLSVFPREYSSGKNFYPLDVAVSRFGKFFILDEEDKEIICYNKEEELINRFGGIDYGHYSLKDPIEIQLGDENEIAILDKNRILVYSIYGKPLTIKSWPDTLKAKSFCMQKEYFVMISDAEEFYILNRSGKADGKVEPYQLNQVENISSCYIKDKLIYLINTEGAIFIYRISDMIGHREDGKFQE
ncbi:MAG: hypothetical protein K9M80_06145 [Candidatus Marinimicrobia bacterium]|nr:hypothetical protein [Candidatus Neomarinimicrobiota bacterium]